MASNADFVAFLPEHLTVKIFSHLSDSDIESCSAVSLQWRYFVEHSSSLWRSLCAREGVVPSTTTRPNDWALQYKTFGVFNTHCGFSLTHTWLEQSWNVVRKYLAMDGERIAYAGRVRYDEELHLVDLQKHTYSLTPIMVMLCKLYGSTIFIVAQGKPSAILMKKDNCAASQIVFDKPVVQISVSETCVAAALSSGVIHVWNWLNKEFLSKDIMFHPPEDMILKTLGRTVHSYPDVKELQMHIVADEHLVTAGHAFICVWNLRTFQIQYRVEKNRPETEVPFGIAINDDMLTFMDCCDGRTLFLKQMCVKSGEVSRTVCLMANNRLQIEHEETSTPSDPSHGRRIIRLKAAGKRFCVLQDDDLRCLLVDLVRCIFVVMPLPAESVYAPCDPHNQMFQFVNVRWLDGLNRDSLNGALCIRPYHPKMRSLMNDFYLHSGEFSHAGGLEMSFFSALKSSHHRIHLFNFAHVRSPYDDLVALANS